MEHNDFIVYLSKIPPEGLDLAFEIADPGKAGVELSVPVAGPIRACLDVQRFGKELRVSGSVEATLRLECSRCLAAFELPMLGEVAVSFAPRAVDTHEEHQHELSEEELDVLPLVQGGGDLRGVIAEQIHLAIPIKPLCSDDCRGLCPRCGRDPASGACGCAPAGADPRWEALGKLTIS